MDPLDTIKLLADATRLRVISLLRVEELSVAELQEILGMGQSRISSHLALLRQAGMVSDRREGKRTFYSLNTDLSEDESNLVSSACQAISSKTEILEDEENLKRVLDKRRRSAEKYFNDVAGSLGKQYCPGRSWKAIGHFLLHLTPPLVIADLGSGEGELAQLLARRAKQIYCIDNSRRMVKAGTELARSHGIKNLQYKLGDIEEVPLPEGICDVALLSQSIHHAPNPQRAVSEAFRILKPGGRVIILDLKNHNFEKTRELYADYWLGFSENQIYRFLRKAGFANPEVNSVLREEKEPHFEVILGSGIKP